MTFHMYMCATALRLIPYFIDTYFTSVTNSHVLHVSFIWLNLHLSWPFWMCCPAISILITLPHAIYLLQVWLSVVISEKVYFDSQVMVKVYPSTLQRSIMIPSIQDGKQTWPRTSAVFHPKDKIALIWSLDGLTLLWLFEFAQPNGPASVKKKNIQQNIRGSVQKIRKLLNHLLNC